MKIFFAVQIFGFLVQMANILHLLYSHFNPRNDYTSFDLTTYQDYLPVLIRFLFKLHWYEIYLMHKDSRAVQSCVVFSQ